MTGQLEGGVRSLSTAIRANWAETRLGSHALFERGAALLTEPSLKGRRTAPVARIRALARRQMRDGATEGERLRLAAAGRDPLAHTCHIGRQDAIPEAIDLLALREHGLLSQTGNEWIGGGRIRRITGLGFACASQAPCDLDVEG